MEIRVGQVWENINNYFDTICIVSVYAGIEAYVVGPNYIGIMRISEIEMNYFLKWSTDEQP